MTVRVLDRLANRSKPPQALFDRTLMFPAVLGERNSLDVLHHEIWGSVGKRLQTLPTLPASRMRPPTTQSPMPQRQFPVSDRFFTKKRQPPLQQLQPALRPV